MMQLQKQSIGVEPIRLGAIPIIWEFVQVLGIPEALNQYVRADSRDLIPVDQVLLISLCNIIMERHPLYKIGEWACARTLLDASLSQALNDDRIGRALQRLFNADRAAILSEVTLNAISHFQLRTDRVHNDSTTITFCGEYRQAKRARAARPQRGVNKDHRPDLKQLVYSLSALGDGAVPLYFKVWDGNMTDDRTHISNWAAIRGFLNRTDFIYVSDSKLCTRDNLEFIDNQGGFFVTVLPQTRTEDRQFRDWIQENTPQWDEVIRHPSPRRQDDPDSVYWVVESPYPSYDGYRIIWVKSSQKQILDKQKRANTIERVQKQLQQLSRKTYKSQQKLESTVRDIFKTNQAKKYFSYTIHPVTKSQYKQIGKGRPSKRTQYRKMEYTHYQLSWAHHTETIRYEARCDGIFPLITNHQHKTPKEILQIYKFQPRIEKRHQQLKTIYQVRPVFLKNTERIEGLLFLYYLAQLITSLIERQLRSNMTKEGLKSIPIYPEYRACRRPTANTVFELFRDVRLNCVSLSGGYREKIPDELSAIQKKVLQLLGIQEKQYFSTPH